MLTSHRRGTSPLLPARCPANPCLPLSPSLPAETVRAMTHVINQGMAMYWGTSRWSSMEIMVGARGAGGGCGRAAPVPLMMLI